MAAPKLETAATAIHAGERAPAGSPLAGWLPAGLARACGLAYLATWASTTAGALLIDAAGAAVRAAGRRALGLRLSPAGNAPPQLAHVLALAAHNLPIVAWPLLLGVTGAHRHHSARKLADLLVAAALGVNTLIVGVALGAYGTPLLAYLPQLPVEWAALALGTGAWLRQREHPLSPREGVVWVALSAYFVLCAAVIETTGVPHR